jgi:uncharacterized protein (DUF885 family)
VGSSVFKFADDLVSEMANRDPMLAVELGLDFNALPDFSLDFAKSNLDFFERKLSNLSGLEPQNKEDEVAIAVMRERLSTWIEGLAAEDYLSDLNNLASPLQSVRMLFDLLPISNQVEINKWANLVEQIPGCLDGYRETLKIGLDLGKSASVRQALTAASQCSQFGQYFVDKAAELQIDGSSAEIAKLSFEQFGDWLETNYAESTKQPDAVGANRYRRELRRWTGAELDPEELHVWGWKELQRINERMEEVATKIAPGVHFSKIPALLANDSRYLVTGEENILRFLREITDTAIADLGSKQFKIDPKIQFCDIKIAPAGSASAPYYMPPSEDLSRPGTTYLPSLDRDAFSTWDLVSTWYHEAVPGHHLQMGTTILMDEKLSRFQRTVGWTSGYAEGWALYAERLMDELGYFTDPGYEMGFLAAQALRAARVVVDTGMHLGLSVPDSAIGLEAGRLIDFDFCVEFLQSHALQSREVAVSETVRYLGLPGQAVSYKVGERMILQIRENAIGIPDFSLADWHEKLLSVGPVGLDSLTELMS